jgi:IS5 family transposase
VWERLHTLLLADLRAAGELEWLRAVADSSRASEEGGTAMGPSPVDRARPGSKHHLLVDATGIPLAWTVTGGNRNDVTQLVPLLERIPPVRGKVGRPRRRPQRVTADRGYDHDKYRRELRRRGIAPEIARRQTSTAPGSAAPAGSLSAPSPGCTTSSGSSSATTAATRYMKPSSPSAATSSASADSATH